MSNKVHWGVAAVLCGFSAAMAFSISYAMMNRRFEEMLPEYKINNEIYGKIGEIRYTVDKYYVGGYDQQDAVDMAAAGDVAGIGDRWSNYMSAEQFEKYKLSFSGQSFGIGLYTSYHADTRELRIVEVFPGSDGEKLELKKGDLILGAEGKTMQEDGYSETLEAIAGEEGTKARIIIRRKATGETETVEMERKTTQQTMVSGKMLADGQTGFIRIYSFHRGSEKQMEKAVDKLVSQGASQLVFDVRNNPGGSVDSVCTAVDTLVPHGLIMTLRTKDGKETIYESDEKQQELPMAVLVNAESISAAEFFAAALQEYGKAVVVGEQTIGKGYAQQNYELQDGSALHLSDQEYFTPLGKSLIGTGVTPDITCAAPKGFDLYFSSEKKDAQLQAALAALE